MPTCYTIFSLVSTLVSSLIRVLNTLMEFGVSPLLSCYRISSIIFNIFLNFAARIRDQTQNLKLQILLLISSYACLQQTLSLSFSSYHKGASRF